MNPAYLSPIANHVRQSTLLAGVAGLLTLALWKNPARVRHWVWLAASCKFLIPVAALVALGSHIEWRTAPEIAPTNFSVALDAVSQPFAAPVVSEPPPVANPLPAILCAIWACGVLGIGYAWWIRWRRIRAAIRAATPWHWLCGARTHACSVHTRVNASDSLLEPGVFGIFDRLTPAQLDAVIAHELCHIRRRDNLAAAIHMFVETLFWFHPLAWWIGKRMVEERELACDEEVLRLGSDPQVYADSDRSRREALRELTRKKVLRSYRKTGAVERCY